MMAFCFSASCAIAAPTELPVPPQKNFTPVPENQVLGLAGGHIRFQLRIDGNDLHLLSEQSAAFVDDLYRVLNPVQIPFANILERTRKRFRSTDLDRILGRQGAHRQQHQDNRQATQPVKNPPFHMPPPHSKSVVMSSPLRHRTTPGEKVSSLAPDAHTRFGVTPPDSSSSPPPPPAGPPYSPRRPSYPCS